MGLFSRRRNSGSGATEGDAGPVDDLEQLRGAVDELRRQLALRVDGESRELRDQLESLRSSLLDELARASTTHAEALSEVTARIDPLTTDLDAATTRLDAIDERFAHPLTSPPPAPAPAPTEPDVPAPPVDSPDRAELAELETHVTRLEERIAAVEVRLTTASTELANQLSELGDDIEALGQQQASLREAADGDGDGEGLDTEALDALRTAQERLANEQARYQIAFRSDLAQLAEEMRRRGGR